MSKPRLNFLVAEDHDFQRNALVRMLAGLGAREVHQAADGAAALAIVRDPARPVDIVISDLDMPGMDGMEFLRHLGESGNPVSIILASALDRNLIASVATMTDAYGISLLGVVEKPLTPGKLEPLIKLHEQTRTKAARPRVATPSFTLGEIVEGLKNDEFEPFFQPKIELASSRIKGAEALARWRHPRLGFVPPSAFIHQLEDNGLIDALTWVMLRKSAAVCGRWRAAGLEATVSVNLSLKSLADVEIANRVTEIVRSQNIEPKDMVLEVTESAAATNVGKALENLARLRMKGFGLSIDDYGTGYSSMQQLTRIAFTELKIDQSFVANATRQESARVILESSLGMARKLRITAVAEGIETQQDWDLLRRMDCDLAQGYFIARPMAAGTFPHWIEDWRLADAACGVTKSEPGQSLPTQQSIGRG
ncbi:MAG TPA: EAL domain-containing response regulator [Thermoanaerobaculia bacterium]|nr:EAL domain-containing response regulator [Thermoanaerobaculia bacterium]